MPRVSVKKKSINRSRKPSKKISKELPASIVAPSVTHGYHSYQHQPSNGKKKIDEKSQRLIIWTGVSVIMTAIVIIWILNLNKVIEAQTISNSRVKESPSTDIESLKNELKDSLTEVRSGLEDLKQLSTITGTVSPSIIPSITPTNTPAVSSQATPNTLPN